MILFAKSYVQFFIGYSILKGSENVSKQITVDQHYVPRFYLRNFSEVKGSGKKEKVLISFFQFKGELYREKVSVKSLCYEDYFYGEDGALENELAEKECMWSKIIRSIIESPEKKLEKEIIDIIKEFAIYQYGRTLATLNYSKSLMSEMLVTQLANNHADMEIDVVNEVVQKKIDDEADASLIVNLCEQLVKELDDLEISIIKFSTSNRLITSDMPVIETNPFSIDKAGMANVGTVIFFPIANDLLVVIHDEKIYTSCNHFMINNNEQDVVNLNRYQILSAEERIMADNIEYLREVAEDSEAINKRTEFVSKRKVDSSYDGIGTFVAMKSRSLKFIYPLSFLKLPKYLYKIPVECREVLHRKYSYDNRLRLLCTVYKLPDLLKNHKEFSAGEIMRRRDGYLKLLNYMDDYWKVPKDQRNITPDLMYKLKTVPTTFFKFDK